VDLFPDSEASITTGRVHEEFATRRGGRRRRRPTKRAGENGGTGDAGSETDESPSNGHDEEAAPVEDQFFEAQPAEVADEPAAPVDEPTESAEASESGPRGRRAPAPRGRRRPSRHDRSTPTITDLLREGQEILVQIAKEPIAKKGARITSHIALPGRYLVYMPTVEHLGVSRKIDSDSERSRLRKLIQKIHADENSPAGGFIVRTAGTGASETDLRADAQYLLRTWQDMRKSADKAKAPALIHRDLDLVQRILRDQLSEDFTAIRIDAEDEYQRIVEFVNRMQPRMVKKVKLYTRDEPILEAYGVQAEIDKAIKPRVWLKSGGYLVINQTEALVSIDVNTGKFVGRGATRLEDTITRTNMEAVEEIARQIRLRDLGGIIVLDLIDMEERRNRTRVMQVLQDALRHDKSPTKVLSFNDFGLVIMTRKRVKQSLERTLCSPCQHCQGAGLVKSAQTVCYEILEQARRLAREGEGDGSRQAMLRVNPEVAKALRGPERDVLNEIEDYLGSLDIASDPLIFQEQFDFAFV
jgi:ribonuclease G